MWINDSVFAMSKVAPQRDEIFKQKVNNCVHHIILQKLTNFHAIRSCRFQNICNEIGWPRFLRHPVINLFTSNVASKSNIWKTINDLTNLNRIHAEQVQLSIISIIVISICYRQIGQFVRDIFKNNLRIIVYYNLVKTYFCTHHHDLSSNSSLTYTLISSIVGSMTWLDIFSYKHLQQQ